MGTTSSNPETETINNNVLAPESLELSTISFHGPTLFQSVLASLGCIVLAVLCYIAFKYCKKTGVREEPSETWNGNRLRRWSLRSVKREDKNLANFHSKMVP